MELTNEELFAARLLRLIAESKDITKQLQDAHAQACIGVPVTDSQETDLRLTEGDLANARRALRRLLKVAP